MADTISFIVTHMVRLGVILFVGIELDKYYEFDSEVLWISAVAGMLVAGFNYRIVEFDTND